VGTGSGETLLEAEAQQAAAMASRQLAEQQELMAALGGRLRERDPPVVITAARGSSDHAATFAKYLIETRASTPVASHAPSVSSIYSTQWRKLRGALFLAISQSGRSPDLVISAQAAKEAGALVVALVNDADSPLAAAADVAVPLLAGPERSVAATKSYIGSLLSVLHLTAAWTGEPDLAEAMAAAPAALADGWTLDWTPMVEPLLGAGSVFVIGRGLGLSIAQEAALKLKETSGLHAEAYSAAEVRHGPMAIVGEGFPVLMLAPNDAAGEGFEELAGEFLDRGARVMMAGAAHPGAIELPTLPGLHPALAPAVAIQSFYRAVARLSLARGYDPDRPPHLRKVTETR
jgi:glucosamine--fructose-6-phosphate aminotransferase (isomerizing)